MATTVRRGGPADPAPDAPTSAPARATSGPTNAVRDTTARRLLRAAAALAAMLLTLIVVPLALWALGQALVTALPPLSIDLLVRPDDGRLLVIVLLAVGWAAWAALAGCLVLELFAAARDTPTPRLPGLGSPQRLAASLVTALTMAVAPSQTVAALMAPALASPVSLVRSSAVTLDTVSPVLPTPPPGDVARVASKSITVARHDTLWLLAEQLLGSGSRFPEIVELNRGVEQSDGHSLGSDGRLHVGWELRLPADADLTAERPDRLVVEPGDTLWDLADDELGDAQRYPELFDLNEGDRQPGGGELHDPDLIQPGWVLELPAPAADRAADSATPEPTRRPAGRDTAPSDGHVPKSATPAETPHAAADRGGAAGRLGTLNDAASAATAPTATAAPGPVIGNSIPPGTSPASTTPAGLPALDRAATPTVSQASPAATKAPTGPLIGTSPSAPAPTPDPSGTWATAPAPAPAPDDPVMATQGFDAPGTGVLLPAGGFIGGLLASGFLRDLAGRRRRFTRHRRSGQYPQALAQPDVEQLAATAVAPGELLERALTELAANAARERRTLPDVRVALLGDTELQLVMATPSGEAIAPFERLGRRRWQLDASLLPEQAPEYPCPYPALVTLGTAGERLVLLNVESAGSLAVTGDQAMVAQAMRALAAELSLGPSRCGTSRTVCLPDPGLAGLGAPGDLVLTDDPAKAAAGLAHHLRISGLALRQLGLDDTRGFVDEDPLAAPIPEIVLSDQALEPVPGPWSGGALITSAALPAPGMTLTVEADGQATLTPGKLLLTLQQLPSADELSLATALSATTMSATTTAATRPPADIPPLVSVGASDGPRLLILGELAIDSPAGSLSEPSRIGRLAEAAAYIMLHPDARPSELQAAMWPQRRGNPNTCRQLISRTRSLLGRTAAGQPYLLPLAATDGRLRMAGVGSDWEQFQRLAAAGLGSDGTAELQQALALVRGRPFGPLAGRELPWADLLTTEMICLISDVALELAARYTAEGNHEAARAAAMRGLITQSESVELLAAGAAASAALGDRGQETVLRRRLAALDDD
ncbi:MAG: hypothetical protein ACOYEV_06215 [Candidatus Nanopelagicales bacterium]